jgi:hypothetical protein
MPSEVIDTRAIREGSRSYRAIGKWQRRSSDLDVILKTENKQKSRQLYLALRSRLEDVALLAFQDPISSI